MPNRQYAKAVILWLKQQVTKHTLFDVFFALWVFTILWPKFSLFSFPGFRTGIRLEDLFYFGFFCVWAFYLLRRKIKWVKSPINLGFFIYTIVGLLLTFFGLFYLKTITDLPLAMLHTLRRIQYFSFFFFALTLLPSIEESKKVLVSFFDTALIVSGFAFLQFLNLWPLYSPLNHPTGTFVFFQQLKTVNANFGGHYELAAFYLIVFALALTLLIFLWGRKEIRNVLGLTLLASILPFFWTYGRASLAGLLFSIVALVFVKNKKFLFVPLILGVVFMLLFLTGQLSRYRNINLSFVKEPQTIIESQIPGGKIEVLSDPSLTLIKLNWQGFNFQLKDPSFTTRIAKWPAAVEVIKKHPLTGGGYSVFGEGYDNDYLRMIGETGLIGLLAFGFLAGSIVWYLRVCFIIASNRLIGFAALGLLIAFLGLLVNALLIDVFESSKVAITFWMLLGVIVKASQLNEPELERGVI